MKRLLFLVSIICVLDANAQNYLITFTGTGESTTVGSVKVENLTSATSLIMNGSDILQLTGTITVIDPVKIGESSQLKFYPNPTDNNSILEFIPPEAGDATISIYDMTGKPVTLVRTYLENYLQKFRISNINNGFYLVSVRGNSYQYSGKLLCNSKANGPISLEKISTSQVSEVETSKITDSKGTQATVGMAYTTGDRLKFTGISGIYCTIKTDIPTSHKTINFNFIACTDGDNINYSVVEIGTQVWMAENLKTTSYSSGDLIGTTIPATKDILIEMTPKYQWAYGGDETNVATYGRLYTWYAITDSRGVCPTGFHIPSDNEWKTFTDFLTNNNYGYGGSGADIGKSMAATSGWQTDSHLGYVGNDQASNNSSGFNGPSGGRRNLMGGFYDMGTWANWYSASTKAHFITYNHFSPGTISPLPTYDSYSVRCLKSAIPSFSTTFVTNITIESATIEGIVLSDGGKPVLERGSCWSTTPNPTVFNSKSINGTGTGTFTCSITGLFGGTTYYLKVYATNEDGTTYGNEISFITNPALLPSISSKEPSLITNNSATCGGIITNDGGAPVIGRGVCWSSSENPTIDDNKTTEGSGIGAFGSAITGLTGGTTYYLRAFATNNAGTAYGNEISFTTEPVTVPDVTTKDVTYITHFTATSGGNITSNGGSNIIARGVCWKTESGPTIDDSFTTDGTGAGVFISLLTELSENTTYYLRAYGTNILGTSYGNEIVFKTSGSSVSDIDGNIYSTIDLGTQVWMAENLRTTKYSNGDLIGTTTPATLNISGQSKPKYQWAYGGNESNVATYGRLYTWYTVTDSRNLCPDGWHIPVDSEWTTLTDFLTINGYGFGGSGSDIGKSMAAIAGWTTNSTPGNVGYNQTNNNSSGFNAPPGGSRNINGPFYDIGSLGLWWSASEYDGTYAWYRIMYYNQNSMYKATNIKKYGFSVRCLLGTVPSVSTISVTEITLASALAAVNISGDGGEPVLSRGVCWSTIPNPTITDNKSYDGTGSGTFTSSITGLFGGTTYYARAYATNIVGTTYGNEISFITDPASLPGIITNAASSILQTIAICGGNISIDGGAPVTTRGVCWSTIMNPTIADSKTSDGTGTGFFTSSITGLEENKTYYLRAYATNNAGTAYGNEISFTTLPAAVPLINTTSVSLITKNTATCGGNVTYECGAEVTARGLCWSKNQNPAITDIRTIDGSGTGSFSSAIVSLLSNTKYYVRSYATNSKGTAYGNEISFYTKGEAGIVSDIDGNNYSTMEYGTQVWMIENLKTTQYSNSDLIGTTTPSMLNITGENTPKYQWAYGGSESNVATYGRLYTWYTATDSRNVCPDGFHVPTTAEWTTLIDYMTENGYGYGGSGTDIGKSISSTSGWAANSTPGNIGYDKASNNSSGFNAPPGGSRNFNGQFYDIGKLGLWWSASEYNDTYAWYYIMYYNLNSIYIANNIKKYGFSVRCLSLTNNAEVAITTNAPSLITQTSAISGGNVMIDGSATITARGVCWSTSVNPTIADSKTTDGTGTGTFTSPITGLYGGLTYYVRAYATYNRGTTYGKEISLITDPATVPVITTSEASLVTQTAATCGGNLTIDGSVLITACGVCWSTAPNPTVSDSKTNDGVGTGTFTSTIAGLTGGVSYYVRAYASYNTGTVYGNEISFSTIPATVPIVTTGTISLVTKNTAASSGDVTYNSGADITSRGLCWSTNQNPTITDSKTTDGSGTGSFTSAIINLLSNTKYYARAYATNREGTAYGNEISFYTKGEAGTVSDIDGNTYPTMEYGTQVWMTANLKTTRYSTGDIIGTTPMYYDISGESTPKYQWPYYGNESNVAIYGRLYTWYTATDSHSICPDGWHVPTDGEWTTLIEYLTDNSYGYGGSGSNIGKSLAATSHWETRGVTLGNVGSYLASNNSSGFTALPGGSRNQNGIFYDTGKLGLWWSSSELDASSALYRTMYYNLSSIYIASNIKLCGFSIRCLSGPIPSVTTISVTNLTKVSAIAGGNVTSDGDAAVMARGVCWNTSPNPTIADSKTSDGSGTGTFTSSLSGLIGGTTYYTRAYAVNINGTAYGNEINFTTDPADLPVIITNATSLISNNSATCGGNIADDGGAPVTVRGVCWSTSANPTIADSKTTDGIGTGTFTSSIIGLTGGTTYYIRAYATNNSGTAYGNEISFTTEPATVPDVTTNEPSLITQNTTTCGGNVASDGGALITARGVCWSTSADPTIADNKTTDGTGTGTYISSMTGLTENTTYHARAYATNNVGTGYGNEISFTTDAATVPVLTTSSASLITQTTVSCGGEISSDGGATVTARGVCWATSENPTIANNHTSDGKGTGIFSSNLTGLMLNTKYYIKAYATNSMGTTYGNEIFFATRGETGTISDIDGNTYSTIEIGTQVWMAENLKTTKYKDGSTAIPIITDNTEWSNLKTPGFCWYDNNESAYRTTYGALYNWYVVSTGNLCPTGWHVPTDAEWTILTDYIGGEDLAGDKLKETGNQHWINDNITATNETGFTALPGGERDLDGAFFSNGSEGHWCSSTRYDSENVWYWELFSHGSYSGLFYDPEMRGQSVRCLKD